MAGINRYFGYTPLQKEDYAFKMPLDLMGKTLMHLQDTSDKNYAKLQQLPGLIHTNALTGHDTTKRNQIEQGYRDKINQIVKGANGDYSRVNKDVIGLKAQLQKDLTTGDLAAIGSNYKTFADYQKETLSQKDLPRTYGDAAIQKTLAEYNAAGGYGGIDPITGNYRQVSPIRGQGYDLSGKLGKVSQFQDITEEKAWTTKEGNWFNDYKSKTGGVAFDRVYNSLLLEAASDPLGQEHRAYLRRIGVPEEQIQKEIIGTVTAEASRRTKDINEIDMKRSFDHQADIEAANERARLGRAQTQRLHDEKMKAEFGAYDGRQAILGSETTGAFSGEVNFARGRYNQDGTPFTSKGTTALGGYYTQTNQPAVILTGKEPLNFNHPVIKNNPVAQKALTATYIKMTGDNSLLAKTPEQQNQLLSNWSSNPKNQHTIQAVVKEETKKMATVYNNKSVTGFRIAGKQAEAEGTDMLAASRSIKIKDLNTGQDYGTLSDYLKSQDVDERNVSTSVNDSKENTGAKLHVTAIKNGYRTIEIKTKNGTRSMIVEGFDRDRENSGNNINFMTKRNENTAFHAPIISKSGYENMTRIDSNSDGKVFTSEVMPKKGDLTADGITIKDFYQDPSGNKYIEVVYPNGTTDKMPFETEDNASRTFHQKDKARLLKTKSSLRTSDVEYTNTGE